jgi:CheY-like chemotaxis protein
MKLSGQHGYQILVVDDEASVRKAIKMLLQFEGHVVQTADSGEAALALLETTRFDLIITDFSMLEMNGEQLAARVKQLRPGQPIIMATASAHKIDVDGKPSINVDHVLFKPFSLIELRAAIVKVMPQIHPN